ncbi:hypothetical protein BZA70DRAFT_185278 [Myxozyma melibiosi]|uniref:Uncharacterized protein n=1 Tax=Myxozyma melibiosi TaxID=54550 RepID=A0ABR1F4Q4_9ASCO
MRDIAAGVISSRSGCNSGQAQDKLRTSSGQAQDKLRTSSGDEAPLADYNLYIIANRKTAQIQTRTARVGKTKRRSHNQLSATSHAHTAHQHRRSSTSAEEASAGSVHSFPPHPDSLHPSIWFREASHLLHCVETPNQMQLQMHSAALLFSASAALFLLFFFSFSVLFLLFFFFLFYF